MFLGALTTGFLLQALGLGWGGGRDVNVWAFVAPVRKGCNSCNVCVWCGMLELCMLYYLQCLFGYMSAQSYLRDWDTVDATCVSLESV